MNTPAPTELDLLKERAVKMGIPIAGNIGVEKLKARIQAKLDGEQGSGANQDDDDQNDQNDEDLDEAPQPVKRSAATRAKSRAEIEQELRDQIQAEGLALVRCRIVNLDPAKRELRGEFVTVANRYLGTITKFIPFGEASDAGYHLPKVLFDDLAAREFQQIRTKNVNGRIEVSSRMVREYSLEILPPLSKEELEELALTQQAAERVGV